MRRVLIVDDNAMAARILSLLIKKIAAHDVQVADDGPSALEKAEAFRPDIVFLDIALPTMDGFEVARQLRAREEFQHTVLVALTGYGQDEDRKKSRDAGFDEHCVKPIDLNMLRKLLSHPKLDNKEDDAP